MPPGTLSSSAIVKPGCHERGVVGEPADDSRVRESAAILEGLRQVPVEQVDERLDAGLEERID